MKTKIFNGTVLAHKQTTTQSCDNLKLDIEATHVICSAYDASQAREEMLRIGRETYLNKNPDYVIEIALIEVDGEALRRLLDGTLTTVYETPASDGGAPTEFEM
jgi:hypothetical protein